MPGVSAHFIDRQSPDASANSYQDTQANFHPSPSGHRHTHPHQYTQCATTDRYPFLTAYPCPHTDAHPPARGHGSDRGPEYTIWARYRLR